MSLREMRFNPHKMFLISFPSFVNFSMFNLTSHPPTRTHAHTRKYLILLIPQKVKGLAKLIYSHIKQQLEPKSKQWPAPTESNIEYM